MNALLKESASIFLLFMILGFGLYAHTLEAPFYFDDLKRIERNADIRMSKFGLSGLAKAAWGEKSARKRPLGNITFALNYYIHGYEPAGYRVVNIIIHVINAVLLYLLLKTTLQLADVRNKSPVPSFMALFATLVWLVHPLHTQSVTYIVQRLNSLGALFFMTSMLLYIHGRRKAQGAGHRAEGEQNRGWGLGASPSTPLRMKGRRKAAFAFYGLSGLSWVLALGCKQTAALLPFFILLYEWYFFQGLSREWLKRNAKWLAVPLLLFVLMTFVYLGFSPSKTFRSYTEYAEGQYTLKERALTQPRVVIHYVSLLFYPHPSRLNLDYDFPLSRSLLAPVTTLLSLILILGLMGLACFLAKKEPLLSFGVLWFFGNLVIESSIIPLDVAFEHRTYLPSMLVCASMGILVFRCTGRRWIGVGLLCAALAVLSLWTYQRNQVWRDPVSLWADNVMKSPNKARPHNNLGFALRREGRLKEAIKHYREALRLDPKLADAHNNLGVALRLQGRLDEALSHFIKAVRLKPSFSRAQANIGIILALRGDTKEALTHLRKALTLDPGDAEVHCSLGIALMRDGRHALAVSRFRKALTLRPNDAETHNRLGIALARLGRIEEAIDHYERSLRIRPGFPGAHNNLGVALMGQGRHEEAEAHFKEALRLRPGHRDAQRNLERVRKLMGQG